MPQDRFPRAGRGWHQGWEEVVVAAVLLVGAIFFRLRIDVFVRGRRGAFLGPDFWPSTLLTIAIVLSAVYLVISVIQARRQGAELAEAAARADAAPAVAERPAAPAAVERPAASTGGATAVSAQTGAGPGAEPHAGPDAEPHAQPHAQPHAGQAAGPDAGAHAHAGAVPTPTEAASTGSVVKLVGGFVLLAAFIYLLAPIGFVPAAYLFSVAFMLLVGERRWWVLLLFPAVAVTVLLGIFTQLLVVSLPRGTGIFVDLSTYLY